MNDNVSVIISAVSMSPPLYRLKHFSFDLQRFTDVTAGEGETITLTAAGEIITVPENVTHFTLSGKFSESNQDRPDKIVFAKKVASLTTGTDSNSFVAVYEDNTQVTISGLTLAQIGKWQFESDFYGGTFAKYLPSTLTAGAVLYMEDGKSVVKADPIFSTANPDFVLSYPASTVESSLKANVTVNTANKTATLNPAILKKSNTRISLNSGAYQFFIANDDNAGRTDTKKLYSNNASAYLLNDIITNNASNMVISPVGGNDFIVNTGNYVTLEGGDGNDTIQNSGSYVSIIGSVGADSISNSGQFVTIDGGADNDYIFNDANNVTLSSGAGEDTIEFGANVTEVDINDLTVDDKLKFSGTVSNVELNANNLIVTVDGKQVTINAALTGGNKWTLDGGVAKYLGANYSASISDNSVVSFSFTDGTAPLIEIDGIASFDSITTDEINRTVTIPKANLPTNKAATLKSNSGGYKVSIPSASNSTQVSLIGSDNADPIENSAWSIVMSLGGGNDSVNNSGNDVTLDFGAGDDYLQNSSQRYSILAGDGNDTINNGYSHTGTIEAGAGNDSIVNSGQQVSINGGADDDYIEQSGTYGSLSIVGGAGNDTITLASGSNYNRIFYNEGDGDDLIKGLGDKSSLVIGTDSPGTYTTEEDGNDLIVKVGEGRIIIEGGRTASKVNIVGEYTADNLVQYTDAAESITSSEDGKRVYAKGGDDTITNTAQNVFIDGGSGKDLINNNAADNVTINNSDGNDTITLGGDVRSLTVQGFDENSWLNAGDVIILNETVSALESVEGGIKAGNVTIYGLNLLQTAVDWSVDGGATHLPLTSGGRNLLSAPKSTNLLGSGGNNTESDDEEDKTVPEVKFALDGDAAKVSYSHKVTAAGAQLGDDKKSIIYRKSDEKYFELHGFKNGLKLSDVTGDNPAFTVTQKDDGGKNFVINVNQPALYVNTIIDSFNDSVYEVLKLNQDYMATTLRGYHFDLAFGDGFKGDGYDYTAHAVDGMWIQTRGDGNYNYSYSWAKGTTAGYKIIAGNMYRVAAQAKENYFTLSGFNYVGNYDTFTSRISLDENKKLVTLSTELANSADTNITFAGKGWLVKFGNAGDDFSGKTFNNTTIIAGLTFDAATNAYQIDTADDLNTFTAYVNEGNDCAGMKFKFTATDVSIGNATNQFKGTATLGAGVKATINGGDSIEVTAGEISFIDSTLGNLGAGDTFKIGETTYIVGDGVITRSDNDKNFAYNTTVALSVLKDDNNWTELVDKFNNDDPTKATAVTVGGSSGDFGVQLDDGKEQYTSLYSITSAKQNSHLVGNAKANKIIVAGGGTNILTGGLGNDTFDFESGGGIVTDYGIGSTKNGANKVLAKTATQKATSSYLAYNRKDPDSYARGADVIKVSGSVTGVYFDKHSDSSSKTTDKFTAIITYDATPDDDTDADQIIVLKDVAKKPTKTNATNESKRIYQTNDVAAKTLKIWDTSTGNQRLLSSTSLNKLFQEDDALTSELDGIIQSKVDYLINISEGKTPANNPFDITPAPTSGEEIGGVEDD